MTVHPHPAGQLTEVTVNLVAQSVMALNLATDATDTTATVAINQAVQLYAAIVEIAVAGHGCVVVPGPTGPMQIRVRTADGIRR